MSVAVGVNGLVVAVNLLNVAGAFKTRVGSNVFGGFSEGFLNASPGVVVQSGGGVPVGDAPVHVLEFFIRCYGGAVNGRYPDTEALETHRLLYDRLWNVSNESVSGGRVLDCFPMNPEQLVDEEEKEWPVVVSQWRFMMAAS